MYYFITHKQPEWNHKDIEILDNLAKFKEMVKNTDYIGADTENNGLYIHKTIPLLTQFSDGVDSYVIDSTSFGTEYLHETDLHKKIVLLHNAQYDYKILKYLYNYELYNIIDTMSIEQILGRGSGRSASLEETHLRRLGSYMPISKATRQDFSTMTTNSTFEIDHVLYSAYDPKCLIDIYNVQKQFIDRYNLGRRVYEIAHPVVSILGDMSLNGFTLDKDGWLKLLQENKQEKFKVELQLDAIIREFSLKYKLLRGGMWTNPRRKADLIQTDLFGNSTPISNENKKNVNYSSQKHLIKLFKILKEPIPQKLDKDDKGEEYNKTTKDSFAEEALEQYKIEYPGSILIPFINKLLEYRKYEKAINSFGDIFLSEFIKKRNSKKYKKGYYNPITDKVHTIYKQEFTKNGRLSSGDVKVGYYNSQQIPKENKYRNKFTLTKEEIQQGWYITTIDLSSAELVILASLSGDKKLIQLIKEGKDLHSHLASAIYTKIIKYIFENMSENRAYDEIANLVKPNRLQKDLEKEVVVDGVTKFVEYSDSELEAIHKSRIDSILSSRRFTVNKKTEPDIRNPVKNIVYGINYGAGEEKVAETLNIAPHFAKLAMEAMREELPDAFAYLDRIANFGVKHGYIIFNDRTNSRHWFKSWLDAREQGRDLKQKEKSSIKRACKNYGISGTQADMIKESMVTINNMKRTLNWNFHWLLQVHDEIVFKHQEKDVAQIVGQCMIETCNAYLKDIEMNISINIGTFWNK